MYFKKSLRETFTALVLLSQLPYWTLCIQKVQYTMKERSYEIRFVTNYDNNTIGDVRIADFDSFESLKNMRFNLSQHHDNRLTVAGSLNVAFVPNMASRLNGRVDLNVLLPLIAGHRSDIWVDFQFIDVDGVDVTLEFGVVDLHLTNVGYYFFYTKFTFYVNESPVDRDECVLENFRPMLTTRDGESLREFSLLDGVKYAPRTCKYFFYSAYVNLMRLKDLTDSYLKKNKLEFVPGNIDAFLGSRISRVEFNLYRLYLNRYLVDEDVFRETYSFKIVGYLDGVESNTFRPFKQLFFIELVLSNTRTLFNKGIEWLRGINYDTIRLTNPFNDSQAINLIGWSTVIKTYSKKLLHATGTLDYQPPYLYPDEDFCLFVNFPFNQLIYIDPHTVCVKGNCTCTLYWLLQYVYLLNSSSNSMYNFKENLSGEKPFYFGKYTKQIRTCKFNERIKLCHGTINRIDDEQTRLADELYVTQQIDFILIVLMPVVSVLGVITNLTNISVISRINVEKSSQDRQQKTLLRFMLAYSIINMTYCCINLLSLLSRCVDDYSLYCSRFYHTQFGEVFYIGVVEYAASVLKSLSNVVFFFISVNRYILLDKESRISKLISSLVDKFNRKLTVFLLLLLLAVTCALNVHKILIFKIVRYSLARLLMNDMARYFVTFPFFLADSGFYEQHAAYDTVQEVKRTATLNETLTYVNFVFNDFLLFFLFTFADILLLKSIRKIIKSKKINLKGKLAEDKLHSHLREIEQVEENTMKIIVANTVVLMLTKVFDLFVTVSKFKISKQNLTAVAYESRLAQFCYTVKFCLVYEELVKIFYIVYYCFSTLFFYYLNRNFRQTFQQNAY